MAQTTVLLLLLTRAGLAAGRAFLDDDSFPGWKGELPSYPEAQQSEAQRIVAPYSDEGSEVWDGYIEQISWEPRIFLLHDFLSDAECDHLIAKARPHVVKSSVVNSETGKSEDSNVRTSSGTFFSRHQDAVVATIERRIAMVTHLPENNGEGLQVLRYDEGQKYEPHHDYFHDSVNPRPENGGNRVATVLMYMSTVEEGGETVFPAAAAKVSGPGWSDCARAGLAVKPKKGLAVLFYSLHPDGSKDPRSLHGSCPVIKGEKWASPKWIHALPFGSSADAQKAAWGGCVDLDARCERWAQGGECSANPTYMLTSCRRSCEACGGSSEAAIA